MNWGAVSRLQQVWDVRAACNFIGGGTGSGLMLWSALGLAAGLPYWPAATSGLAFVAAGLFMVWLEIGRPWRALHLFFRPQTSWMTREGIVALPLLVSGALAVLLDAGAIRTHWSLLLPLSAVFVAVLSLLFLYCQLRILNSARGLPAWREPRAMLLLGLSGLTEGLGLYLLVLALSGHLPAVLLWMTLVLLVARVLAWHAYLAALARSRTPGSTLAALLGMRRGFLLAGHLAPGVLILSAALFPGAALPLSAAAGALATSSGWMLKVVLVTRAAYIPKYTVPMPPVRGGRDTDSRAAELRSRRPV